MRFPLVALTSVAAVSLAACGGSSSSPQPTTTTTVAKAPPQVPSTPAVPAVPATPPEPKLDALDWRSSEHRGQPTSLIRTGSGFYGIETRAVAKLSGGGKVRWRYNGPATDDFGGFVVGGRPFAVPATGPEPKGGGYTPHAIKALDPKTGKVLWSKPTTHYASTDGTRVFGVTCTGAETGALGDCVLTAYKPLTGETIWTRPIYANQEGLQSSAGSLVARTFPDGRSPRFVVLDPATGAVRASIDVPRGHGLELVGDRLVDGGPTSAKARKGKPCSSTVTSYSLTGSVQWRRTLPVRKLRGECDGFFVYDIAGKVGLNTITGAPRLLSPATGRTVWSGKAGESLQGTTAGRIVVQEDGRQRTIGIDAKTYEQAWAFDGSTGSWDVERGYAITNSACKDSGGCSIVLDARTGEELLRVPGVPESVVSPRTKGGRAALLTRIDARTRYAARYGFVTLPAR